MRRAWWLLPPLAIVAVLSPMIFTSRSFDPDWTNHMWLVSTQRDAIAHHGHPSWFLHSTGLGVFYPQFAFYGGTLYGSAGLLSFVLGVTGAYIAFFAIGLAMSFGGWTWLARRLGVVGPLAFLPGLLHITAAYVMANAYGRGAWPEFVATMALPLVIAAVWDLLTAPTVRPGAAAALVFASVYLTGSHNITLVWGVVFLGLAALAVALGAGLAAVRAVPLQRFGAVAGLMALGVGVNAWFLIPDLLYAKRVHFEAYDNGVTFFNTASVVLSPIRRVPSQSTSPGLTAQAPVLALAWALVALAVARPWRDRLGRTLLRVAGLLCLLLAGFLVLVLRDDPLVGPLGRALWAHVPNFLRYLQFAFRLETYVTILVIGLVVLALLAVTRLAAGRLRTGLLAALAAIAAVNGYQAVHQAWRQPSFRPDRSFVAAAGPHRTPIS
ncbi:MAG TPA: hypothetical protein VFW33_07705, partial [Gemmataceae bacterium]|nr:hypothetical protein [Gemmataceae bacterium]